MNMVRVVLPHHLRNLAQVGQEVQLDIEGTVSVATVLDALEARYPMLKGTIRDHGTHKRRAFLRFFACGEDISLEPQESPLPVAIQEGHAPLQVIGAIAGG